MKYFRQEEEPIVRILSDYSAPDILDSQEITEQLLFISEIFVKKLNK